ncbi:MAG TPA: hypothetical protein VF719_07425, partial [Abditibacteriaceae bacterium]
MTLATGTKAPALTLKDLNGVTVSTGTTDSVAVLAFINIDCSWCVTEMPKLVEAFARHADLSLS